jgi:hypothetical protein
MQIIQLRACQFEFDHAKGYCCTTFSDGARVPAVPHDTDEYRQRAFDLGYGDNTTQMCFDHELLHTLIAEARGDSFSRVLRHVAVGCSEITEQEIGEEEARVMEFQKFLKWVR